MGLTLSLAMKIMMEKFMFDDKRKIIEEEVFVQDIRSFFPKDGSFQGFVNNIHKFCNERNSVGPFFIKNCYTELDYENRDRIYQIIKREENDKEYGARIAKEKAEYNKYLTLKSKFEKE